MDIFLTNTISRKKEKFIPLDDKIVKMYVCGITPYDYSHIGHGRCYVNFDVLVRLFEFLGYKVTYVRNITDIDDKILNRSEKEEGDINKYSLIADKYTKAYWQDMKALNCLKPTFEPKVTENIDSIINFIKNLIDKKHAYILDKDVFFEIESFKDYGKLSSKKLEDLKMGSRVEIDERKKNPADFVLWKGNDKNLFWKSPWGYGRPGWHIECSVMAQKFLGDTIDIHGGGMDLIFPHHENEIAQSESFTLKPFVRYWLHNAFININKEKMSKSLGNFFTLRLIFEKFDPMVLRFYFLQHQYKTPIEFTLNGLHSAEVAYKKLVNLFDNVDNSKKDLSVMEIKNVSFLYQMLNALCDDLNTPKMLGILFENYDEIKKDINILRMLKTFLNKILGLKMIPINEEPKITPDIEKLIKERELARKDKNWKLADEIRDRLVKMGYEINDKKI